MNKKLLAVIADYKPGMLLVLTGDNITVETLKTIKKTGIIIANWFTDSVIAPVRRGFVEETSPFYDYFFCIDSP